MTTADCFFPEALFRKPRGEAAVRRGRDSLFKYYEGALETIAYPKAPLFVFEHTEVPKRFQDDVDVDVPQTRQAQLEEALPPFHRFAPDRETVETFVRGYNGKRLDWLSLWLMRSLM